MLSVTQYYRHLRKNKRFMAHLNLSRANFQAFNRNNEIKRLLNPLSPFTNPTT